MRFLLAALLFSLLTPGLSAQVQLRPLLSPEVAAITAQPPRGGHLGLLVRDLSTGQVVEALRPDELFTPASTTKLLSMAAWLGLRDSGAAGTGRPAGWLSTEVTAPASEVSSKAASLSVITLRGSGDPSLSITGPNSLAALARQLAARGVKSVAEVRLAASIDSATWPALPLGTPVVSVRLQEYPGWSLSPVRYQAQVLQAFGRQLRAAGIRVGASEGHFGRLSAQAAGSALTSVPAPNPKSQSAGASQTPPTGALPDTSPNAGPDASPDTSIATVRSAPISTLLTQTLKPSDNVWAEQLAAGLGAGGRRPASHASMIAGLRRFLAESGVGSAALKLHDASGLSPDNRLSPRALVALLRRMYDLPTLAAADLAARPAIQPAQAFADHKNLFIEALAQGGTGQATAEARFNGGTLAGRFIGSGLDVRAKTGTLPGVSCLAGYVRGASGHTLAFAVMLDQAPGGAVRLRNYIDQLVRVVAARH
ncbi:D-alanyl-D-alanine carboxypeptidase [Deinococcus sp.]|uniref:D-alanyl-D-alanine carboxypeptidase n=1 Tax=Deinococcus sp. TaxID=47478 RepID=UPI0025D42105|nr:D-alanyl-D-alanine carboxypeptidase [Deinococcus sp.]